MRRSAERIVSAEGEAASSIAAANSFSDALAGDEPGAVVSALGAAVGT